MAAASGQPQDTNSKKAVTPQQRRLFTILGILGALALLGGVLSMTGLIGGGGEPPAPAVAPVAAGGATANAATGAASPAANTVTLAGVGGVAPGIDPTTGAPTAGVATGAAAPAGTGASALPQGVQRFRPDPFQQAYFLPTPVPTLPPPLLPVDIPSPTDVEPVFLPGVPGGSAALQRPLNLPPVKITRLDEGARRPSGAFPPRRTLGGGATGGGGAGVPDPSYDKRLSGVVIADGVRAILEIQGPAGPISRVVQPGDEVEGITVLNIQRFNDGTRTVTRMLIRENGEERTVELRAGVPIAPPGGAPGTGGFEGVPPV